MKHKRLSAITTAITAALFMCFSTVAAEEQVETRKQNQEDQQASQQLAPIKVIDDSISKREDLDPNSLKNPYRVETTAQFGTEIMTQEDIQDLQPSDIYDLLDKAVSMNVTYQGRKHPFFLNQRGGGSFTYIIDGAVLPPSTDRILYKFPLAAIEELQIVRGSTSLTLGPSIPIGASSSGSGTNTGFIIIRTKQPDRLQASMTVSGEQAANQSLATNMNLYVGTDISSEKSKVKGYIGALVGKMDRPSKNDWFDGRNSTNGMANTGMTVGKFSLNVMGYMDRGRFEMQRGVGDDGTISDVKWYYDPLETRMASTDMTMQWTANQVTMLNLFDVRYEQVEHNESFASASASSREYEEETKGFGLRHNARFFTNTLLQVGGQWSNSKGLGPNLSRGYNKYDTTVIGWSASLEQKFFEGDLVLDGGFRQDYKHIDNSSSGRNASSANDDANNDVDMAPANIFAFGVQYRMFDLLTLGGRYYHGEQGMVGDFDMRSETGELHPESQDRIEATLAAEIKSYFNPSLTWFNIEAKNSKSASSSTYEIDGATYYYYTESDGLRSGLELMFRGRILKNTTYKVSWTHMLANESTRDGETTDKLGVSKPENYYTLALTHQWRDFRFSASVRKIDAWVDPDSSVETIRTDGLGGYTRVDAKVKRTFDFDTIKFDISLFGRNLLDEDYSTMHKTGFYPDRGRAIGMEFTVAYR